MRDTRRPERPVTPLIDDHVELERRIREVSSALDGADFPSFDAVWCDLEDFALSHLAAEEEELIPRFVLHDPEEAATLLAQHRQIRDGLLEVGVAEQLHAIRKERVDALLDLMAAHREREERGLYAWAAAAPGESLIGRALASFERLRRAWAERDNAA